MGGERTGRTLTFEGLMGAVAALRGAREGGAPAERSRASLAALIAVKSAEAVLMLPDGWTVTRAETAGMSRRETQTQFSLYDEEFRERTYVRCAEDGDGASYVHPGPTVARLDPEEARGRAVLLLLASLECAARKAAIE